MNATTSAPINKGRTINFLTGISGVAAGGQALINIPINQRIHRITLQPTAVNYSDNSETSTTDLIDINSAGIDGTVTTSVTNGVITGVTIVAGGSGYAVDDTVTITDTTGAGAVFTVTSVDAGAITGLAVTVGGTPTPIDPVVFFTSVKILVNGVNMRDITPASIIAIAQINGFPPQYGSLPIFFTEPWRNILRHNETTSWDLFNQGTMQVQLGISPTVVQPGLNGIIEFDYLRNLRRMSVNGQKSLVYFLNPVAQHQFTQQLVSGRNDVNQLPWSNPISRIWIAGASPGNIYQLEVYQDGNKVLEATTQQIQEAYGEYGFQFMPLLQDQYEIDNNEVIITSEQFVGKFPYGLQINSTATGLVKSPPPLFMEPANVFDTAFIADPDQRLSKALKCASSLNVRVYCTVPQAVTFVMETLPAAYSA